MGKAAKSPPKAGRKPSRGTSDKRLRGAEDELTSQSSVNGFYKKYENIMLGKYTKRKQRAGSAISVQETSATEMIRGRKIVTREHPLLQEQPEEWKNIPICLTAAVKQMITSIVQGNESVYES